MAEAYLHPKTTTRITGEVVTAEEKADFLLKNNYPVPTTDYDELVELIQSIMDQEAKRAKEEAAERILNDKSPALPRKA
jgi:ABC-type oligopeptide transport system substrate-binding subunit